MTAVLLTATDATVTARLTRREAGSTLAAHLDRSRRAAARLDRAPDEVVRLPTDTATVPDLAAHLLHLTGWSRPLPSPPPS